MIDGARYKSDAECIGILKYLFKDAFQLYGQIAPQGWIQSPYVCLLHPTPEQQYEEHLRLSANLARLTKAPEKAPERLQISDFKPDELTGISERGEFLYVLGLAVYDIFSNNHHVVDADNRIYLFGSFRGSGRFIADFLNQHYPDEAKSYDYLDFYMGSIWIEERGDLTPFYEYVFQKLKHLGCDWEYAFPKLYLIDPQKLLESSDDAKIEDYDPETSVKQQIEASQKEDQARKLQEELEQIHAEEYEAAKYQPLSRLVQAYKNVYGVLPQGHPQKGEE